MISGIYTIGNTNPLRNITQWVGINEGEAMKFPVLPMGLGFHKLPSLFMLIIL